MLYLSRPKEFIPEFEVVSCLIQWSGRFLFLLRHPEDIYGNLWGVPTGKKDWNETVEQALKREVLEETGIQLQDFKFIHTFFVVHEQKPFIYHLFNSFLHQDTEVRLNPEEHIEYCWCTLEEALELPLVPDMKECLIYFKGMMK